MAERPPADPLTNPSADPVVRRELTTRCAVCAEDGGRLALFHHILEDVNGSLNASPC